MNVQIGSTRPGNLATDALLVALHGKGGRRSPAWQALNQAIGGGLDGLLRLQGWSGRAGELVSFPAPAGLKARLVLVGGLGEKGGDVLGRVRELATKAAGVMGRAKLSRVAFYLDPALDPRSELDLATAEAIGAGLEHGAYRFEAHRSQGDEPPPPDLDQVFLYFEGRKDRPALAAAFDRGAVVGRAQNIARDLVNQPANVINPSGLEAYARALAAEKGLQITVLDEAACRERGMEAFLAVGRGAADKCRLVHLTWAPPSPRRRVALVGKAVTFDSGGLCLKPAGSQATMKMDMGGSAAVIAAVAAAADLGIDTEVHAIFAACENMTGADAYHTGDVLKAANGKTIEVLNTDAEGRLTLADALHYAAGLEPDLIVDLATLTGACMVALGPHIAGIMGTGRGLIRDLRAAGDRTGEPMWELPMPEEYKELIKSKIADIANVGGRWGGAITAGLFLSEFVPKNVPWAHIDIAGPCFYDKPMNGRAYGATGFPVRALMDWLSAP
jgi:leucyl aminopeptidase